MQTEVYTKVCPGCKTEKELLHFSKCSTRSDGVQSACKKCQSETRKKDQNTNPEKFRLRSRNHYKNNVEERRRKHKEWHGRNREKVLLRAAQRDAKRGGYAPPNITEENLIVLMRTHVDTCDMQDCGRLWEVLDHDHKNGNVRGLLCNAHNVGLGCFRDSPDELLAAARYLERLK